MPAPTTPVPELPRLAYELSLRALSQQESALNELRARTGALLTASSIVASFLGAAAIAASGLDLLTGLALVAFGLSVMPSIYILVPRPTFVFALSGVRLLEEEFDETGGIGEVHRRLAYWIESFRDANQRAIDTLVVFFRFAALSLAVEVVLWALALASTL